MDRRWRWDEPVPLRWLLVDDQTTGEQDVVIAECAEIEGLFVDSGSAGSGTTLLGCRPHPPLRRALDALARGAGNPGGALRRRWVNASVHSVDQHGDVTRVLGADLRGSVTGLRASALAADLLDVTVDSAISDPMPGAARQIWDLWRVGRPSEPGLWAGYDRELRHHWSGAALVHHRVDVSDKPAGSTYHLDGRNVTNVEGFYCAVGEAVNGPGGYFGWNGNALHDCLTGGWGARRPFRLVWHDAAVARTHLTAIFESQPSTPLTEFEQILHWLAEDEIDVELR